MKKIVSFFTTLDPDIKAYLVLFFSLLLLYWPVSFMIYSFKWDMAVQYIPWRHHISLSIHNFEFPLWNAYQGGGYPIHADPQSGAFYPIVWLLTFIFGQYHIVAAHAEFILTVYIAACGFYKLCRFFHVQIPTAIITGLMYACSGIFIGNTQHLTWLIAAAFLPCIFYSFFALSQSLKYKYIISLALFMFLLLTGGYPGFAIILIYLLVVFFIHYALLHFKSGKLVRYGIYCLSAALLCLLFTSGFLYSIYTISPYTTRGDSISLALALENAFTIPSFLSFILPFATCKHNEIIGTDISMANAYFGLFFLACLPVYFFRTKKTSLEKIILVLGLLCLMASVGESFPLRAWLYHYLPLMNYFRFPSAFRIFVVLFFLLLASIQFDKQKETPHTFRVIAGSLFVLFVLVISLSVFKNYSGTGISDFFSNRSFFHTHSTFYDHIILQSTVQISLAALFFAGTFFQKRIAAPLFFILLVADIIFSVHLNLPYTSLDTENKPLVLHNKILQQPGISHIPVNFIYQNNDQAQDLQPVWRNLQNYKREIGYDGYNPFTIKNYDTLAYHPYLKKSSTIIRYIFPKNIVHNNLHHWTPLHALLKLQ